MTFQVYDVSGGGAWRDALKFEHGDSGDSSATNWPRVHLGSNVALTGLGTMAVGMIWGNAGVPLTTSPTNLEAAGMNQIYKVNGAIQINLPAAADVYSSGSDAAWVQFELFAASVLSINPDGTEILRMQGTNLAAGNEIDTPATVGTIVTCIATDDVEDGHLLMAGSAGPIKRWLMEAQVDKVPLNIIRFFHYRMVPGSD
jgi:hypothetical protein